MSQKTKETGFKANDLYVADFCEQMAEILKAGLTVEYGLELMLEDDELRPQEKAVLENMLIDIRSQGELSKAMDNTGIYPKQIIDMISIGEKTGHLEKILYSLKNEYERRYAIKKSVRNIVVYPLSISMVTLLLIGIILVFVMPVFKHSYASLGIEMSGVAKLLFDIGEVLSKIGLPLAFILIVVFLGVLVYVQYSFKTNKGTVVYRILENKETLDQCKFAGIMALYFSGGIPVSEGLNMALEFTTNEEFKQKVRKCIEEEELGVKFCDAVRNSGIFHGRIARRITMAQNTAELDVVMNEIADELQVDLDQSVNRRMAFVEPVLVGTLSLISVLILFSVMLPLLGVMSSI